MDIVSLLIIWLVVTVSLLIVSYIPLIGVEIDSFGKALVAGAVFGVLNVIAQWFLSTFSIVNFLTIGLLGLIINVIVFGLAAKLVEGFHLRHGVMSAILGAFFMAVVSGIVNKIIAGIL
ncbi:MAG: phage holin family protein [Leptolyngbyaceae bacterium]|nr:phage holin family protein [Leptolyngbyaceae bacterium]